MIRCWFRHAFGPWICQGRHPIIWTEENIQMGVLEIRIRECRRCGKAEIEEKWTDRRRMTLQTMIDDRLKTRLLSASDRHVH